MSYGLSVVDDAAAAINLLDVEAQEAIYDRLDTLAGEAPQLRAGGHLHVISVETPASRTFARLRIVVDHGARACCD